jgi:hypothetical protein
MRACDPTTSVDMPLLFTLSCPRIDCELLWTLCCLLVKLLMLIQIIAIRVRIQKRVITIIHDQYCLKAFGCRLIAESFKSFPPGPRCAYPSKWDQSQARICRPLSSCVYEGHLNLVVFDDEERDTSE